MPFCSAALFIAETISAAADATLTAVPMFLAILTMLRLRCRRRLAPRSEGNLDWGF